MRASRAGGRAARAASRPAERRASDRDRARSQDRTRLRGPPAVRPALSANTAQAGNDRPRGAVRAAGQDNDDAGRDPARSDRGDVRGRAGLVIAPGRGRAAPIPGRAGLGRAAHVRIRCARSGQDRGSRDRPGTKGGGLVHIGGPAPAGAIKQPSEATAERKVTAALRSEPGTKRVRSPGRRHGDRRRPGPAGVADRVRGQRQLDRLRPDHRSLVHRTWSGRRPDPLSDRDRQVGRRRRDHGHRRQAGDGSDRGRGVPHPRHRA